MNFEVEWSPKADEEYSNLIDDLISRFGIPPAIRFDNHVEEVLTLISQFPKMYPKSITHPNTYKCVLSKQTTLFYRINGQKIELISFWINRKNPEDFRL